MNKNKNLGFLIQSLFSVSAIILYIISFFEKIFLSVAQIFFALALFSIAYNNHKIFKRKYFTMIYIIFGVILLIGATVGIING